MGDYREHLSPVELQSSEHCHNSILTTALGAQATIRKQHASVDTVCLRRTEGRGVGGWNKLLKQQVKCYAGAEPVFCKEDRPFGKIKD